MSDAHYEVELPEPIPTGQIVVDDEQHQYITREDDDGNEIPQTEYTLDKAPVKRIEAVTGTTDNGFVTFNNGTDYELSGDGERIVWDTNNRTPDAGSQFYVTYTCESIISRFLESGEEEFHHIDHAIDEIIDSKLVDRADGQELDKLGKLFGEVGQRRGRQDPAYRTYLKSVVQSIISRGTIPNIKEAIAAATGIDVDTIVIDEDFVDVEYDVIIPPNSPHQTGTIADIAEVADPSGVELDLIRYRPDEEEVVIDDTVDFTIAETVADDEVGVTDAVVGINRNLVQTSDAMEVDDGNAIDPNLTTIADEAAGDDTVAVDQNKTAIAEDGGSADAVTTDQTTVAWDAGSWDDMNWAVEH